jgi:hypothetical protein
VTAKLPEQDGEFGYHVRNIIEQHERMAHEGELQATSETKAQPVWKGKRA